AALDRRWRLPRGADVLTEISTKFDPGDLADELAAAGLDVVKSWTDDAGDFQVTLSRR
ncbi:L-histidine N(alpha)-methyltransferase, partial [Streptomyces sp. SID10244]|nr:L-histidine N(alpha)-methyltransferase [Streptomyces sp. SID10244]